MAPPLSPHLTTTTFQVKGMSCSSCTSSVESGLRDEEGVFNVSVSLVMDRAVVIHDAGKISAEQISQTIEDLGFDPQILSSDKDKDIDDSSGKESIATTTLHVTGMTCGACTSAVEGAFLEVAGVKNVSVSLLSERAVIEHNPTTIPPAKLAEIVEDAGFDAQVLETKAVDPSTGAQHAGGRNAVLTTTIAIEGMTCGACTSAVESGFKDIAGVQQFNVSLLAERAVIIHDPDLLSADQIVQIIEDCGFDAKIVTSQAEGAHITSSDAAVQLKIYGLADAESASNMEELLGNISGVTSASMTFSTLRATIHYNPVKIGLRAIVDVIEKAGYNALVADTDDNNAQLESLAKTKEIQEWYRAFKISLTFAIPVLLISMLIPMFLPALDFGRLHWGGIWLGDVVCLLLTIPVQFGIGKRFYVSAHKSLRHGSPTMDVLVVLGTSAAFFFSCVAMLVSIVTPPHSKPATTFDTSTMLITFIVLGRFLENRAKGQTSKALSRLMSLAPSSAVIYADPIAAAKAAEEWQQRTSSEKGSTEKTTTPLIVEERSVPTELLEVGDVVIVKPGDKISADGLVTRGESFVDESMVTGEAMPILKKTGVSVMAGTVNGPGRIDFKVTRAGRDTQLSQIVRLVQEAQTTRAPIQRMADTVAGFFVPIIITLGLATFVGWMLLSHLLPNPPIIFLKETSGGKLMVCVQLCIAVIVFACPCALGLATPTAVMVGTGVGAEQGILIKGGAALETATRITHIVLDKTGTLTLGKMSVSGAGLEQKWNTSSELRLLWWTIVGLAEGNSEHPIARAILHGAKERLGLGDDGTIEGTAGNFLSEVGRGISATVELASNRMRYEAQIGNASYLQNKGITVPLDPEDEYTDLPSARNVTRPGRSSDAGSTIVHVAIDGEYSGSISLSDTLKPSARACISALHHMGISTSLVTGDQPGTAKHVASLVGIPPENVFAGVLPSGKQTIIEDLQAQGEIVAMVGDGINDSPALAIANVGISLASGTDVAMEAADIVLMKPLQLMDIPASLHLSRTIFRRIKYNLAFSCVYNAIGIPIAMGFLLPWGITLPPMAAGAAMASSSVTVVVSSLLLKFWKRPSWLSGEEALAAEMRTYRQGMWSQIAAFKSAVTGKKRKAEERDRGVYVPLDNLEAV